MVTQREIDVWRVEAQEMIRQMLEEWRKGYLARRVKQDGSRETRKITNPNY